MSDFPKNIIEPLVIIIPNSLESIGGSFGAWFYNIPTIGAVYPTADLAFYIPFVLAKPITVVKLFCRNSSTVSGNVDIRLYSADGTALTASMQTAQTPINSSQEFDITDVVIGPGVFYIGIVLDNTTGILLRNLVTAELLAAAGVVQEQLGAGAALPNVATFAHCPGTYLPACGLTTRTVI